jgi:hypothetical protein
MTGTCIIRKDAFWECRNIGIRRNTDRGIYIWRYSGGGGGDSSGRSTLCSTSSRTAWTMIVWNPFSRPIGSRVHRPYMTMMMTQEVMYLSRHFCSIGCDIAGIIVLIYTFWLVGGSRNGSGGSKGDDMLFLLLVTRLKLRLIVSLLLSFR